MLSDVSVPRHSRLAPSASLSHSICCTVTDSAQPVPVRSVLSVILVLSSTARASACGLARQPGAAGSPCCAAPRHLCTSGGAQTLLVEMLVALPQQQLRSQSRVDPAVATRARRCRGALSVEARRARAAPPKPVRLQPEPIPVPAKDAASAALRAWLAQWAHDDCGVRVTQIGGAYGCAQKGISLRLTLLPNSRALLAPASAPWPRAQSLRATSLCACRMPRC